MQVGGGGRAQLCRNTLGIHSGCHVDYMVVFVPRSAEHRPSLQVLLLSMCRSFQGDLGKRMMFRGRGARVTLQWGFLFKCSGFRNQSLSINLYCYLFLKCKDGAQYTGRRFHKTSVMFHIWCTLVCHFPPQHWEWLRSCRSSSPRCSAVLLSPPGTKWQ